MSCTYVDNGFVPRWQGDCGLDIELGEVRFHSAILVHPYQHIGSQLPKETGWNPKPPKFLHVRVQTRQATSWKPAGATAGELPLSATTVILETHESAGPLCQRARVCSKGLPVLPHRDCVHPCAHPSTLEGKVAFLIAAMAQAQPRTDKGHLAPHVLLQVCEDESPREEDELTGPQCRRCQAESPSRHPCRPGTIFSWAENPHLQVQKAVDHEPLLLIDTDKNHHVLDFDDVSLRDGNCFRAWRSRFLFILMGPRDLPQRLVTQEAPTGPRPAPLQFRWRDNLHLVRDDFAYLMCAPGDTSWDIKVLTMIDTTGVAHTLAFGTGTDTGCRVEKWRTQTINNTIKSFRRVFGKWRVPFRPVSRHDSLTSRRLPLPSRRLAARDLQRRRRFLH